MAATFTVNKLTHNRVCVTWEFCNSNLRNLLNNGNALSSPQFYLVTDGHLVLFSMIIDHSSGWKLTVKQEIPKPGRAIVAVSLDRPHTPIVLNTQLLEFWNGDYRFNWPGSKPPGSQAASRVIIKCEIIWLGFCDSRSMPRTPHFPEELCLPRIPYTNECRPDVKLIIEGKELPAHKSVLTLHSPIFLEMFDAPIGESKENQVVIEDVDFVTMETIIKIIYSGKTQVLEDITVALNVLAVAEKYQMLIVKTACEYKLQLNVNRQNVLELLEKSDKCNASELSKLCIEYIVAAKNILTPDDLEKIFRKKAHLSAALMTILVKKLSYIPPNVPPTS